VERRAVRGGRRTLRIDGSFASTWEPGRETTGSVWDGSRRAVGAAAEAKAERALLGLGGGSAARAVRALSAAGAHRRSRDRPGGRCAPLAAGSISTRSASRSTDDAALPARATRPLRRRVRGRAHGQRAAPAQAAGLPAASARPRAADPAPGGIAVCNTLDESAEVRTALAARFARLVRVTIDDYENQIFVASDGPLSAAGLRSAVARDPVLGPSSRRCPSGASERRAEQRADLRTRYSASIA
jgi:hypothetical protein